MRNEEQRLAKELVRLLKIIKGLTGLIVLQIIHI